LGLLLLLYVHLMSSTNMMIANHENQRKLPWTSTLQVSLTLALVNPVLWYIIDRSRAGFVFSATVGALGTSLLSLSNPALFPSPASASKNSTFSHQEIYREPGGGYVKRESIEGAIWILSVLFCSCVCFGNIGRRLALSGRKNKMVNGRGGR
jgi:amino acid permease